MKAIKNKRNCSYNANNGTFTTVYEWRLTPKGLVLIDTWWKRLIYFNYWPLFLFTPIPHSVIMPYIKPIRLITWTIKVIFWKQLMMLIQHFLNISKQTLFMPSSPILYGMILKIKKKVLNSLLTFWKPFGFTLGSKRKKQSSLKNQRARGLKSTRKTQKQILALKNLFEHLARIRILCWKKWTVLNQLIPVIMMFKQIVFGSSGWKLGIQNLNIK